MDEASGRLCSDDYRELRKHLTSLDRRKHGSKKVKCAACGEKTFYMCRMCDKPVCFLDNGVYGGGQCMVDLHDEECFGLLRCDSVVAKHWKKPDKNQRRKQANHIRSLLDD